MEIKNILSAVSKAYKDFQSAFRVGKPTDELFLAFSSSLEKSLGKYDTVYDYIWGKDTLNIDGVTKGYIPKTGDTVIMDISVGVDGVWCDVCRTFFVGEITDSQKKVFELVKKSIRAGHSALKVNAKASDIYSAVNAVYKKENRTLVHHAGHMIGEKPLMQPQFLADNQTLVESGKIYTIESGLYENFGIRLENNYLVNDKGAEDLFEELLPLDIKEYLLK